MAPAPARPKEKPAPSGEPPGALAPALGLAALALSPLTPLALTPPPAPPNLNPENGVATAVADVVGANKPPPLPIGTAVATGEALFTSKVDETGELAEVDRAPEAVPGKLNNGEPDATTAGCEDVVGTTPDVGIVLEGVPNNAPGLLAPNVNAALVPGPPNSEPPELPAEAGLAALPARVPEAGDDAGDGAASAGFLIPNEKPPNGFDPVPLATLPAAT